MVLSEALSDKLVAQAANSLFWLMTAENPIKYFKTSPKIIRLVASGNFYNF
jgi:hypothetical protein